MSDGAASTISETVADARNVAIADVVAGVPAGDVASTETFAGGVTIGAVVSTTVTVADPAAVLNPSFAVNVTVVTLPVGTTAGISLVIVGEGFKSSAALASPL